MIIKDFKELRKHFQVAEFNKLRAAANAVGIALKGKEGSFTLSRARGVDVTGSPVRQVKAVHSIEEARNTIERWAPSLKKHLAKPEPAKPEPAAKPRIKRVIGF